MWKRGLLSLEEIKEELEDMTNTAKDRVIIPGKVENECEYSL